MRFCLLVLALMALVTFLAAPAYARSPCRLTETSRCFEHVRSCVKRFCKGSDSSGRSCSVSRCSRCCAILDNPYNTNSQKRACFQNACFPARPTSEYAKYLGYSAEGPDAIAVKFGVIAYDAFKEHLGDLTAVTMDPPRAGMRWDFSPAYLFKFEKYGIVAVYVRQARMKNGKIWSFSPNVILKEVSRRYKNLTKEQLRKIE